MSNKLLKFNDFLNEVSLEGLPGIPDGENSWLRKVDVEKGARMQNFQREHGQDLSRFMQFVGQSQQMQRGHEEELSELTVECFKQLFGSFLDDVELDFKLNQEARDIVRETPIEPREEREEEEREPREEQESSDDEDLESGESSIEEQIEKINDETLLKEVARRKILRTIMQGKGLNSKALLNLPMFKKGVADILGERADEYIRILNKISSISQFNDWMLSEQMIKNLLQGGTAGVCKIDFDKKEEDKDSEKSEDSRSAEDFLKDLEDGEDLGDSEAAKDLVSGINARIIARGVDLSVLIHEALKAVYTLPLQRSLEHLYGRGADRVIANTDTLLDEAQEFKYSTDMQQDFHKAIVSHPDVAEKIDSIKRSLEGDDSWNDLGAFEEQLFLNVYGILATMAPEDPDAMLETVYHVLMGDKSKIEEFFYPIVESALDAISREEEYQASMKSYRDYQEPGNETYPPMEETPMAEDDDLPELPRDASLEDKYAAILAAFDKGGNELAAKARAKYLGEGLNMSFKAWKRLNEMNESGFFNR
jgi:hypothetical protein